MRAITVAAIGMLASLVGAQNPPELNLGVSQDVAPSSKVRLVINTRNLPTVGLEIAPIDGEPWLRALGQNRPRPVPTGPAVSHWTMRVGQPGDRPNPAPADTYYSRQINLPKLPPGVYLVTARAGDLTKWSVVNVTDLGLVVKRSARQTLVWVTRVSTGKVVSGAKVELSGVNAVTTNSDGVALFPSGPGGSGIVVVRADRDLAAVFTAAEVRDGRLVAHVQTDRPIYRPGQTVNFKAIARRILGTGYRVPAGEEASVEIRDAKDLPIDRVVRVLNANGTMSGSVRLSPEGALGAYTMVLRLGGATAYQTFRVAEYRKPEFMVTTTATPRALSGQKITFDLAARTYFGTGVADAQVTYQIRRRELRPFVPDEGGYFSGDGNFYPRDTYGENAYVAGETITTDRAGRAQIELTTDLAASDSTYELTATVADPSRRQVATSGAVPVYASSLRLSVTSGVQYAGVGNLIPITVTLTDLDGKPAKGFVTLEEIVQAYDEKSQTYRKRIVETTQVRVTNGVARLNLPAKAAGDLTIRASAPDNTYRIARATTSLYVDGEYILPTKTPPPASLVMRTDRRIYALGQTIRALITTNRPGLPILLTQEGGDLGAYRVIRSPKRSEPWSVRAEVAFSPNTYLLAHQWAQGQPVNTQVMVPIPDPSKQVTVRVQPDRPEYLPGERAKLTFVVTDAKGQPAASEVALNLVDEAIYAVSPDSTPDLFRTYWGLRGNSVLSTQSMPEEISGGAYQRVESVAPVRSRFEDTGLWQPTVSVGPSGRATVDLTLPDNLTTWRATARAVDTQTRVGTAQAKFLARRPVTLRLAVPRQAVVGDTWDLIATVDNRMPKAARFHVTLVADGLAVAIPTDRTLDVGAGASGTVTWPVRADRLGETPATVTARVQEEGTTVGDALRLSIPIVPHGVAQRVLASGSVGARGDLTFDLPADKLEPATKARVRLFGGVGDQVRGWAEAALSQRIYAVPSASERLVAGAILGRRANDDPIRDALAALSRCQTPEGWGWWETATPDAIITANVARAMGVAQRAGIDIAAPLRTAARNGAIQRYNATGLWETRARLAAAIAWLDQAEGAARIREVTERGNALSPLARLELAEVSSEAVAAKTVADLLPFVSDGPVEAYLPAGSGAGWVGSDVETTGQLLIVLKRLGTHAELFRRLSRWLTNQDATAMRALWVANDRTIKSPGIGPVRLTVNDQPVGNDGVLPRSALVAGRNVVRIERDNPNEVFATVEAGVVVPSPVERSSGIRVLRRFETMNVAGQWAEVRGPISPAAPLRCTVVVWGDEFPDALRLQNPIPTGFEFLDSDGLSESRQEVRDGAVIEFLVNRGTPQVFRFYLRAESVGRVVALPAWAESLRRPGTRGQTDETTFEIIAP